MAGMMTVSANIALVFAGGGMGALCRYLIQQCGSASTASYYYTAGVNIAGSVAIGMLWALFEHLELPRALYLHAITGFLGGFTTFSAFSLDVVSLMRKIGRAHV